MGMGFDVGALCDATLWIYGLMMVKMIVYWPPPLPYAAPSPPP